jgi:hypothetical protein
MKITVEQLKKIIKEEVEDSTQAGGPDGKKLIYSDGSWDAYIPETWEAAQELGKGTWWEVSTSEETYHDLHTEEDPVIIFKSKTNPKRDAMLHFGSEEYFDHRNEPLDDDKLIPLFTKLKKSKFLPAVISQKIKDVGAANIPGGGIVRKDADGATRYYDSKGLKGNYHRVDGPAVIWPNGTKEWYTHGILHRTDGPAIEYADGTKVWFLDGKRHRTDGPAVETAEGDVRYYLNDRRYENKAEWEKAKQQLGISESIKGDNKTKITMNQLKRIIKEEVQRKVREGVIGSHGSLRNSKQIEAIVKLVNQALAGDPVEGQALAQAYFDCVNKLNGSSYKAAPGIEGSLSITGKNLPGSVTASQMGPIINSIEFAAESEDDDVEASFSGQEIMNDIKQTISAIARDAMVKVSGLSGYSMGETASGGQLSPEEEEADYDRWTMDDSGRWVGSYHPENPKNDPYYWNESRQRQPKRKPPIRRR